MNVPKIKGTHNAMKSAMLAAESIWDSLDKASSIIPAYTINERIIRNKFTKPVRNFSCRWGLTHRIDDLYICPPNTILDIFRLLLTSYF